VLLGYPRHVVTRVHATSASSKVVGWTFSGELDVRGRPRGLKVATDAGPLRIGDLASPTDYRTTRHNDGRRHPGGSAERILGRARGRQTRSDSGGASDAVNHCLGPMCTDVGVLMVASPFVEMLRQMSGEAATSREVGLADEDDWHTWRVATLADFKESDEIGEVLCHDETVLDHCEFEYILIGSAGQLHVVDRHGVVIQFGEPLGQGSWEHLVQQPPHEDSRRSRRSMRSRSCPEARSSAAIRSSTSVGLAP